MIDASKGFIKDGNKNRLREQDLHRIVDTFTRQADVPHLVTQVLARPFGATENRRAGAEALRHERCGALQHFLGGGFAKPLAVADKERVSHDRRLQRKLTRALPHGA
jgi:type I restriction-modification system DNA methylase subunit